MSNKDDKTQSESRTGVSPKRIEKRSLSTAQHTNILAHGNDSKQSGDIYSAGSISTSQHTAILAKANDSKQSGGNQSDGGSDNGSSSQSEAKGSGGKS